MRNDNCKMKKDLNYKVAVRRRKIITYGNLYSGIQRHVCLIPLSFACLSAIAQTASLNYVKNVSYLNETGTDSIVEVSYYDGIGRPIQRVQGGLNCQGLYLHFRSDYDGRGRETVTWIPVIGGNAPDYIADSAFPVQSMLTYNGDTRAFSEMAYDALDRKTSVSMPGEAWQGKSKKATYKTSQSGEVRKYDLENIGVWQYYGEGELLCMEEQDEDGRTVAVYTDFLGNRILERRMLSGEFCDTYYVYDRQGRLSCVLPPEFHRYPSAAGLGLYAFRYSYDQRGNIIQRKSPGCDPVTYEYDLADRVVRMQDALLRNTGRSRVFSYDGLGRMTKQSICHGNVLEYDEIRNYYDSYDIPELSENPCRNYLFGSVSSDRAHAQLTATVRHASNGETMVNVFGYDEYGRVSKLSETGLQGRLSVKTFEYSFTGDVTCETIEEYSYDSVTGNWQKQYEVQTENKYDLEHTKLLHTSVIYIYDVNTSMRTIDTIQHLAYDDFGHVSANDRSGTAGDMTYEYDNLHGWLKSVRSGSGFSQHLYREDSDTNPLYNGSISAMSWKANDNILRSYHYDYDGLNRLVTAEYSSNEGAWTEASTLELQSLIPMFHTNGEDYSEYFSYDRNGNLERIERYGTSDWGEGNGIDDLYLQYSGNRLMSVYENSVEPLTYTGAFDYQGYNGTFDYTYDGNGSLTSDDSKDISNITYDHAGNPRKISFYGQKSTEYVYTPDGSRQRTLHARQTGNVTLRDSVDYMGSLVVRNGKPAVYRFNGGYCSFDGQGNVDGFHYYIQDYQGNVRMVVNTGTDAVEQVLHYYPYGGLMGDISTSQGLQPYMYSGKELDRTYGLDLYDFHARQQDPVIGRFTSPDPKAEDYYHVSPYAYCAGDPVNNVDPTGMTIVADSLAQIAMINSLPENERTLLHFDNNGNLTVNQAEKPSEVLADILKLVESNTIYNLYVSATDMNGTPFRNDQSNYYKGYTQTPTDPNYPSQEGNVHVYMSSLLKGIELPLNFGHEVLSHALFYEMGLPFGHDYEYQPIKKFYKDEGVWGYELKRVDKNTELNLQINRIQKIIKQNYNGQK